MKRYHVTTFGCQMNEHDSERMRGLLEGLGYAPVDRRDDADLILFNTCTIRGSADERFLGNLGDAKRVKRERPATVVAVGGCWAQSMKEQVFREFPFVDIAFGPSEVARLGELVARERIEAVGAFSFDGAFSGSLPSRRERPHQAWVQISVGCNCVCAYCVVPSVRGRERSRPPAEVVGEVAALAADGVREVTLLGQNVNSYGRDLTKRSPLFARLLREVGAIDGGGPDTDQDLVTGRIARVHVPDLDGVTRRAVSGADCGDHRGIVRPARAGPCGVGAADLDALQHRGERPLRLLRLQHVAARICRNADPPI